jgi:hypothetical protein
MSDFSANSKWSTQIKRQRDLKLMRNYLTDSLAPVPLDPSRQPYEHCFSVSCSGNVAALAADADLSVDLHARLGVSA